MHDPTRNDPKRDFEDAQIMQAGLSTFKRGSGSRRRAAKAPAQCIECGNGNAVGRGRCSACYGRLRSQLKAKGKWKNAKPHHGRDAELHEAVPQRKPWEWEGDEASLIAANEAAQ